jgi:hypothetical protein
MSAGRTTVGVVDYGMGNRRSVEKALERVGARALVTGDHDALMAADGLIVPGVGALPAAMAGLRRSGLDELIVRRAEAGSRCSASASACSCFSSARRSSAATPASACSAARSSRCARSSRS